MENFENKKKNLILPFDNVKIEWISGEILYWYGLKSILVSVCHCFSVYLGNGPSLLELSAAQKKLIIPTKSGDWLFFGYRYIFLFLLEICVKLNHQGSMQAGTQDPSKFVW